MRWPHRQAERLKNQNGLLFCYTEHCAQVFHGRQHRRPQIRRACRKVGRREGPVKGQRLQVLRKLIQQRLQRGQADRRHDHILECRLDGVANRRVENIGHLGHQLALLDFPNKPRIEEFARHNAKVTNSGCDRIQAPDFCLDGPDIKPDIGQIKCCAKLLIDGYQRLLYALGPGFNISL